MGKKATFKLTVPIVKFYDDPDDKNSFIIEGLASDTSVDSYGAAMEPSAIFEMAGDFAKGIVVDIEHMDGWADELGDVVEASILDTPPPGHEAAVPPILWTKLKVDKMLSHGKDLYYLLSKGRDLGLSITGFLNKYKVDEDEVLRRLSVTWTGLAVTKRPANQNAWLNALVLSAQHDQEEGGELGEFPTTGSISFRDQSNQQEDHMSDQDQEQDDNTDENTPDFGRVMSALSGIGESVETLSGAVEVIGTRVVALEAAQTEEDSSEEEETLDDPLAAVMSRLDELSNRMELMNSPQQRSGEELMALLASRRHQRRGIGVGNFSLAQRDGATLDAQFQNAVEAGDFDQAKGIFWNRLDVERGLIT